MAITAHAGLKALKKHLENKSKHAFQRACFDLLVHAWPALQYAPDLGLHDRRGADLFSFGLLDTGAGGLDYEFVVQCKGIEDKELNEGNYKAALGDIEKFRASGFKARRYWLVLNRSAKEPGRAAQLNDAIAELAASGVVVEARWFDPQALLVALFDALVIQQKRRIVEKNAEQLVKYNNAMREHERYVSDVPYSARVRSGGGTRGSWVHRTGRNALKALSAPRRNASSQVQRFRLVVSEFGFGKTLLLLQLANQLGQSGQTVLYQPVVELPLRAFSNEFEFVKGVYKRLFPEDETPSKKADHPPLFAFREILRRDSTVTLLLDGLDEHTRLYSFQGLRDLFNAIKDLACDVVLSARKEFFDAFEGNFDEAMAGTGNDREFLSLSEWDDNCMLKHLQAYPKSAGIETFRDRIRKGEYYQHYGDIPRRPLFLDMLAGDLDSDPDAVHDLASLYRHYLERKMKRDVRTAFAFAEGGGRPMPLPRMDIAPFRQRLIELQEVLAAGCLERAPSLGETVLRGEVTEVEVREAANQVGLEDAPLPELLQHSVLMPSGKTARAALLLRFAHRSLQEFLAASWLARCEGSQALSKVPPLPAGVHRFLEEILRHDPTSAVLDAGSRV